MSKVLIIEDNELVANIYRNRFVTSDFQAETAPDGETGLELLQTLRPDAVLLDLMLPGINGVEVLKKIRVHPDFKAIPVVVFSNTYLTHIVGEAWKAGATRCLSKANSNPRDVVDLVNTLLGKQPPPPPREAPPDRQTLARRQAAAREKDEARRKEIRHAVLNRVQAKLADLRTHLVSLVKRNPDSHPVEPITILAFAAHQLGEESGIGGFRRIAIVAEVLEAFLEDLADRPEQLNASTLRTIAGAVDFLGVMAQREESAESPTSPQSRSMTALVVDDDPISRRAVVNALGKACLAAIQAEDAEAALKLLSDQEFDLILLDVGMPGMNGFELCARLRALPRHAQTPVIFVTGLGDFESRAKSTLSGGNDLMAKPFLSLELALKSLLWVFRRPAS